MPKDPYRLLAERLDSLPNGFPSTESGVELRLLARICTPEEALMACSMSLEYETAASVAARVGMDPEEVSRLLENLSRKGVLSRCSVGARGVFALRPFIVGIYEFQLPRMDREMAALVEQYFLESGGGMSREKPHLHRVLPIEKSVSFNMEIFPYERAAEILGNAKSWAVRQCICRTQQKLIGRGCEHPVDNCLVFAPFEHAFDGSDIDRPISRDEALRILREAAESGLVHSTANYREGVQYICNCCTCCCGVLRGLVSLGIAGTVAGSGFQAVVAPEACIGCGECVVRCPFGAMTVVEGTSRVEPHKCAGCGQCSQVCPTEAIGLVRREGDDRLIPPSDVNEWRAFRRRAREEAGSISDKVFQVV